MTPVNREDIQLISRHSNWTEADVDKLLKDTIYPDAAAWKKFLRILFISLGVCFSVAGILFFFAYNWDDLHKFAKLGLIEGLIVLITLIVLLTKINSTIKNIILTGAAVLIGVLFAVFGQIYQTEANTYDLFLGWTLFIALWVIVSDFAPLWLIFLSLINTTFVLYSQQVARDWPELLVFTGMVLLNAAFLLVSTWIAKRKTGNQVPAWFLNTVALVVVSNATVGISIGILDEYHPVFIILIILTALLYIAGIKFGLHEKRIFYLAIIPFSLIIIISVILLKDAEGESMFFVTSLFIIASVTILIKNLVDTQKKWANEAGA
jgi:uncharacterized membrane protein